LVCGRTHGGVWSWLHGIAQSIGLASGPPEGQEPTALVDLAKPSYRIGIAKVQVSYARTALDVTANDEVEGLGRRDRESGPEWQRSIEECLRR